MKGKRRKKPNPNNGLSIAVFAAIALLQCKSSHSNEGRPNDAVGSPSPALSAPASEALGALQRQIDRATPQGVLRVATLQEAAVAIYVDPQPGLLQPCPCLAAMAAKTLASAGYSAVAGGDAEVAEPSSLRLSASSNYLEGKTTLILYGDMNSHLGVAPEIYEAALISGDRNPSVTEVEALVARVILSEVFQNHARSISLSVASRIGSRSIAEVDINSACKRSR
jgi:hypothetical protein